MTDIQQIRDDISFMRGLVEDDGSVLKASATGLLVAGTVFGLAALRTFALDSGWLQWPGVLRPLLPFDAPLLFFIVLLSALRITHRGAPASLATISATSRTLWASWAAVGFGYVVALLSLSAAGIRETGGVALAFWGSGWLSAAAAYRRIDLALVCLGCYGAAIAAGLLAGTPYVPLLMALAFWLLVALPGLLMLREIHARGR